MVEDIINVEMLEMDRDIILQEVEEVAKKYNVKNLQRLGDVIAARHILKRVVKTRSGSLNIRTEIFSPTKDSCSIEVKGTDLEFCSTSLMELIFQKATAVCFWTFTDKKVEFDLVFYGLNE